MKYLLPLLLFLAPSIHAQTITTIAGTGVSGYSGDGGPATAATMHYPQGIAMDGSNNIYFSDDSCNCIRKIDAGGTISRFAGTGAAAYSGDGGPASAAAMMPSGLCFDPSGNLYVADRGNDCIRKIDGSSIITTFAGRGFSIGSGIPATASRLIAQPEGIACSPGGDIYIGNYVLNSVWVVDPSETIFLFAGMLTSAGYIGVSGDSGDGGPATAALLSAPRYIATDNAANVYITDLLNNNIRKVDASGVITTIAGVGASGYSGDGGLATAAQFANPAGIVVSTSGEIFIADRTNNCIRKIDRHGIITTVAGSGGPHSYGYSGDGGPATAALMYAPYGIALDCANNLYITDTKNNRIRRVQLNHAPAFAGGAVETTMACAGVSKDITTLLAVNDPDSMNTETWSLLVAPAHGTATAGYVTNSTGSTVTPTGLTYTANAGYYGMDTFRVAITDCEFTDSVTIAVRVDTGVHAGMITGADTLCTSHTPDTLADSMAGGIWRISNGHATVSATGAATGISAGTDTVQYVVTNGCGSDTASHAVMVVVCPSLTPALTAGEGVSVYPNPASDELNIDDLHGGAIYIISNMMGVTLLQGALDRGSNIVNTASLPPGIYVLCVTDQQYSKNNYKIIKQ
jgi:sugar lactone lactonase YvrE